MDIKYFYYISDYKVSMLKTQVKSMGLRIPDINPKMEFAGISLGANVKFQKDENLVRETLTLINALQKSGIVKSLNSYSLDTKNYYKDESVWFSGIFSFEPFTEKKIGAYFLWRTWNNSIILLVGSPRNILGVRNSDGDEMMGAGTPIIMEQLLGYFISTTSRQNETEDPLENLEIDPEWLSHDIDTDGISFRALQTREYEKKQGNNNQKDGVATILFCAKHLRKLRQQKVETLFKVIREVKLDRKNDLPELISELAKTSLQDSERNELSKCKQVFIGSPIYTALI